MRTKQNYRVQLNEMVQISLMALTKMCNCLVFFLLTFMLLQFGESDDGATECRTGASCAHRSVRCLVQRIASDIPRSVQ